MGLCCLRFPKQHFRGLWSNGGKGRVTGGPLDPYSWAVLTDILSHQVALCSQVALGMEHLSNNRFVHKDLAARNCLISAQRQVKVSALGLSKDVYNRYTGLGGVGDRGQAQVLALGLSKDVYNRYAGLGGVGETGQVQFVKGLAKGFMAA